MRKQVRLSTLHEGPYSTQRGHNLRDAIKEGAIARASRDLQEAAVFDFADQGDTPEVTNCKTDANMASAALLDKPRNICRRSYLVRPIFSGLTEPLVSISPLEPVVI
jgi:hypothetical protein